MENLSILQDVCNVTERNTDLTALLLYVQLVYSHWSNTYWWSCKLLKLVFGVVVELGCLSWTHLSLFFLKTASILHKAGKLYKLKVLGESPGLFIERIFLQSKHSFQPAWKFLTCGERNVEFPRPHFPELDKQRYISLFPRRLSKNGTDAKFQTRLGTYWCCIVSVMSQSSISLQLSLLIGHILTEFKLIYPVFP